MRKLLGTSTSSKVRQSRDKQLAEFEKADLGDDIRKSRSGRMLRRSTQPTSILLDNDLIERLKERGSKRGLGYQTMLKMIVREHLDDY